MEKYRTTLIITSLLCLLPIIAGIVLWDQLPDEMATHFGANNEANGWMPKPVAVIGLPLLMVAIELVCFFASGRQGAGKTMNDKAMLVVLWMMPVLCNVLMVVTYSYSLGNSPNVGAVVVGLLGFVFIALGNYLPKTPVNTTFGIRVKWTYEDPENWQRTNRLAGLLMVVTGALMVLCAVGMFAWPGSPVLVVAVVAVIAVALIVPVVYSYVTRKK